MQITAGHQTQSQNKIFLMKFLGFCHLRGEESQGMILAASDENGLAILDIDKEIALGSVVR